jgi:hypothetical protein
MKIYIIERAPSYEPDTFMGAVASEALAKQVVASLNEETETTDYIYTEYELVSTLRQAKEFFGI